MAEGYAEAVTSRAPVPVRPRLRPFPRHKAVAVSGVRDKPEPIESPIMDVSTFADQLFFVTAYL